MARTKSQNGKRSRSKGAAFERWVTNELVRVGISAERNIAQTRTAAREGCDVEGTEWWIECKVGASPDPRAAYAQADSDRGYDERPLVVVWKRDRCDPMVTMAASDLRRWFSGDGDEPAEWWKICDPLVTMRFSNWLTLVTP